MTIPVTPTTTAAVVVGIDGSGPAWQALTWAAERAEATSRPLHIIHAEGALSAPHGRPPKVRQIHHLCSEAIIRVRKHHPDLAITCSQPAEAPIPALVNVSRTAAELVLGTRGMGAVRGAVLGSVTIEVSATAHCPVIVVRGASANGASTGPVVVGVDGQSDSVAALDFAFEDAERRGVPLVAVYAWQLDRWDFASGIPMPGGDMRAAHAHHQARLEEALAAPAARHPGVEVTTDVVCAPTAGILANRSNKASLLVVGTRGRRELSGLMLGSVSQALMRRSACPVAVVTHPHTKEARATHRAHRTQRANA